MSKAKINLYVDIVSPFAYMGFYMLRNSPLFQTVNITYIPIFLGGLMKSCNNRPPLQITNKDKWINAERLRWSSTFNIPMSQPTPPGFPILTINVQRALAWIEMNRPEKLAQCLDALYQSAWVDANPDINKDEGFGKVLVQVLGEEGAKQAVEGSKSAEAKKRVTENTQRCFEIGAFGLPWFECTDGQGKTEGFWGFDHLGQVVRFLGLEGRIGLEEERSAGLRSML